MPNEIKEYIVNLYTEIISKSNTAKQKVANNQSSFVEDRMIRMYTKEIEELKQEFQE